jgi:D-xylulose kinase
MALICFAGAGTVRGLLIFPPARRQGLMMRYFLGIDSGTQSTKAIVVDEAGGVLGRGQAEHRMIEGLGVGHKEQHPGDWIAALKSAVREAIAAAGIDGGAVAGIGVSGQQHGFVALDAQDEVIRPAKLWCDTSTAPEAAAVMDANGGREAFQRLTGNALPAGFTASKILWLKRHEPENFARLAAVLLPHDYVNFWLTGVKAMEFGDASGTGLLDVRTRSWCGQAIMSIDDDLGGKLPELRHSGDVLGRLRGEAAEALGLSTACMVSMGGGDNMMGAIGTGNVLPGAVTVSLGTSGTVYAYSAAPIVDAERGEIAAFCDSTGGWLPLLCTMNVTVATELVKRTFGLDNAALGEGARAAGVGANGLMLLPYFEGERVPDVPDGAGVWLGYREGAHGAGHFARAAMEGAALGLAYGFERMRGLGIEAKEIRLTGGGAKSPVWRQIMADVFGVPVVCTAEAEGAALGAAIQARWALERKTNPAANISDLCRLYVKVDEETRCQPDAAAHDVYTEMLRLHEGMSIALRPVFTRHRALLNRL